MATWGKKQEIDNELGELASWWSKPQQYQHNQTQAFTFIVRGRTSIKPLVSLVPINPFKLPSCDGPTTKSFHQNICRDNSTTTCLFESILMPKSLMQECYKMLVPVSQQSMSICHFCYIYCVLHMNLSSTCVLGYAMPSLQGCRPCIFVINVGTSTSMQSSSRDITDFRGLEFH